jgi:hypothetical protein
MTLADIPRPTPDAHVGPRELSLAELIDRRKGLDVALAVHEASVRKFWPEDRPWFVIQLKEELEPDAPGSRPRHLTSSASCFESLADQRPGLDGAFPPPDDRGQPPWADEAARYAMRALNSPAKNWTSDEAAHIYCRVRALPCVLRYAPTLDPGGDAATAARARLQEAFAVIDSDRPLIDRGLGERELNARGHPRDERAGERYPANTFHAYWGLKAHIRYVHRQARRRDLPALSSKHLARVRQNEAWAYGAIGRHTALLNADKRRGDAQQLAYAVVADLLRLDRRLTPASAEHDLYQAALATFFAAQEPSGRWPLSRPLFHYPISGNAYCYTFETLTELLRPALPRDAGRIYRALLEPYLSQLFDAWDYAMRTRVPLDEHRGDTYGWSSTHHVARDAPEAWATAEVFSFGQLLRCVAGHVVAERAATELGARRPDYSDREKAEDALAARGDTYAEDDWTVGRQLASMFLHPAHAPRDTPIDTAVRDPDAALIGEDDARSAVLFGPPGTGKTTIVEALAGALGWEYVEVLASDFLREGVDGVPAQADRIFQLLMQLDRCVVLFDEVDELIQDRTGDNSDPFGRFLTTSMLPKIAKLWKQRRLIFFVATNHVSRADAAITRTSRFDARIFVAPPGIATKRHELAKELETLPEFEDAHCTRALAADDDARNDMSKDQEALGVLPLLRYDQIAEVARRLRASGHSGNAAELYKVLSDMRTDLLHHEWQPADKPTTWDGMDEADRLRFVYREYLGDVSRDFSRRRLVRAEKLAPNDKRLDSLEPASGRYELEDVSDGRFLEAPENLTDLRGEEGLLFLPGEPRVVDRRLLWFRPSRDGDAEHHAAGTSQSEPNGPEAGEAEEPS